MAAAAVDPSATVFELRVLDGQQRGASAQMPAAGSFEIGGLLAAGCDVQLRDPQIGDARVRVMLLGAAGARIEVLGGEVKVNGKPVPAGEQAAWPLYVPLRLGGTVLALGEPDSAQWQLPMLVADGPGPAVSPPEPAIARRPREAAPAAAAAPVPATWRQRPERWVALGGAALVLVAAALWLLSQLLAAKPVAGPDAQQRTVRVLMTTPGFQELKVEAGMQGPVVRGHLGTQAERDRLQRVLADNGLGQVQLEVFTGEQLATAVGDVFRVQGITAQAQGNAMGQVTVRTQEPDAARLERAAATARRDVAGLASLSLQNRPPAPPPENVPVVDDPGKRIASIVPGDSAYVVTADGTRYFVGALLPTGHRIEAIEANRVQLARGREQSELSF
jgi:type III secretion protein D